MLTEVRGPSSNAPIGSILSHFRHTLRNLLLRFAVRALSLISPSMDALVKRIQSSPGIPVPNPSTPYWSTPPSPIARYGSDFGTVVPSYADVVIIGSGITGTSFARTLLDYDADHGRQCEPLQVVMLEAREACSGATGRNGGHITPVLYAEYSDLKEQYGMDAAKQIIRFRLSHFPELLSVATEEGLLKVSQCRQVEAFDVFYDSGRFKSSKEKLAAYQRDLPCESADYKVYEGPDDMEELQLSPEAVGCFSTKAGAIHPYRLVTGILSRLIRSYTNSFHLYTQTPCTVISSPTPSSSVQLYNVTTPKGVIQTPHIIHATNGWVSHLLPGMRGRILPARGVMTAQMPWKDLGTTPSKSNTLNGRSWTGTRSFVFFPGPSAHKYDYLTQQAPSPLDARSGACQTYPSPMGELMFGGGFSHGNGFLTELGNADDREWNTATGKYLSHILEDYFAISDSEKGRAHDRVKSTWGGILGISVDQLPWVGRIPEKVSSRPTPLAVLRNLDVNEPEVKRVNGNGDVESFAGPYGTVSSAASNRLAAPGEWMAAGYTGEGMVHAWMSGKALAYMVLGLDKAPCSRRNSTETKGKGEIGLENWFPDVFKVTEERWENIGVEDLFASFMD